MRGFGVEMRPGEGAIAVTLFAYFFLIITFQYVSKSVRQATFIDQLGAEQLPLVYVILALATIPILYVYGRVADRVQRQTLVASTSVIVAATMVGFWWLYGYDAAWIRVAFYVWISIVYVLNVSQFWSYSHHVLDPRQAKRLFGFIGAGGLLGGVVGGQFARVATRLVDTRFALLVAAAFLIMTAGLVLWLQHRFRPESDVPQSNSVAAKFEQARGGMSVVLGSRHLRLISAIMLLTIVVASVVDLQFNWAMDVATADLDEANRLGALTGGYGNFYTLMGSVALIVQLLFAARIHRRLGLGVAMGILPVTLALGTAGLFVAASLLPAAMLTVCRLLKIGEAGIRYSLDQTTRELLFLPVPAADRVKAKAYIDVFVQRSGKALGGILLLPVTLGVVTVVGAGWISLVLIVIWLIVIVSTRREYVTLFRDCLKRRAIDTALPIDVSDGTTLQVLTQSLASTDPRQVQHSIEILGANDRGNLVMPLLLLHDDVDVRLATLDALAKSRRTDAVSQVEQRLGDDSPQVRARAIRTLGALTQKGASEIASIHLRDSEASVRAASAVCAYNDGDDDLRERASVIIDTLADDADPIIRVEGARAIGGVHGERFRPQHVRLLYDRDRRVARAAILAARHIVERSGFVQVFPPILVSLLQDRRLKHVSRSALVSFGESVLPTLIHFMEDRDESLWVRRALPKTIALIPSPRARVSLINSLPILDDVFLRRKIVEALSSVTREDLSRDDRQPVVAAVRDEAERYRVSLTDLCSLQIHKGGSFHGPLFHINGDDGPNLLGRLLTERMADSVRNIFGLLALIHPAADIKAAHRGVISPARSSRAQALEFLENALERPLRRIIFSVIGDEPTEDRVGSTPSRVDTLRKMIEHPVARSADGESLAVAAMYTVHCEGLSALYPAIELHLKNQTSPLLRETAQWITRRAEPDS